MVMEASIVILAHICCVGLSLSCRKHRGDTINDVYFSLQNIGAYIGGLKYIPFLLGSPWSEVVDDRTVEVWVSSLELYLESSLQKR